MDFENVNTQTDAKLEEYSDRCISAAKTGATNYIISFNFWHLGTLALRTERQSAQMSEIKNVG